MAKSAPSELIQTFLEEHRMLMRGLAAILEKVEAADFVAARRQADELDQAAGSHIQFEEEVLYPEVGRARGRELERQLRDEHSTVRHAIKRLLEVDLSWADTTLLREELGAALRTAVRHAESCGTLVSHLRTLSPADEQKALSRLIRFRNHGKRWTELPTKGVPGAASNLTNEEVI